MIVVDTMVIIYLMLPGERSEDAVRLRQRDPEWLAPPLWRSELRNVLATLLRTRQLGLPTALATMQAAELAMRGRTRDVASKLVLQLAAESGCSAYDCEFVALAREQGMKLVTADKAVLRAFPETALALSRSV